jgi:hypothetical protein
MFSRSIRSRFAAFLIAVGAVCTAQAQGLPNPLIFVTQTPDPQGISDFGNVAATFGNHLPDLQAAARGGTLHIVYPDGTLRDLLADALNEACASGRPTCDPNGVFKLGGVGDPILLVNGYAVREPTVHWDGNKVIFSLLKNVATAKDQQLPTGTLWQIYEITGLKKTDTPVLTKVANQPAYNNIAPIYGSDDRIFFASDRPVTGKPFHKELDHYESQPSTPGLWKLDPGTGQLALMVHASSGVFSLFLDSFGQVIFMQWDHMQQDQQALNTLAKTLGLQSDDFWQAYTYANEDDNGPSLRKPLAQFIAEKIALNTLEGDLQAYGMEERHVPEYHESHPILAGTKNIADGMPVGQVATTFQGRQLRYITPANKYGRYDGLNFNKFFTWQVNQDGTGHETFRHTGLDDLAHFATKTYMDDSALSDLAKDGDATPLARRFGHFNVVEAPVSANIVRGTYVGIASQEFSTHTTGFILQMRDNGQVIGENGKNVSFEKLTNPNSDTLYRNPIFLSDGTLLATVDEVPQSQKGGLADVYKNKYRLYKLRKSGSFYVPDMPVLPATINKNFNYWDPGSKLNFNGAMWQLNPVEVMARARPPMAIFPGVPAPEMSVFTEKGVDPQAFRQFLIDNDLALIVSRNVTKRDKDDVRQPFNLRVDPANVPAGKTGAKTIKPGHESKPLYDVAKLQLYQADLLRGYATKDSDTRRSLVRPMHFAAAVENNPPVTGPVPGSVSIAYDGSFAAFVPATRALTWTLSDKDNDIVVRERYQLKFAPGEVRVCASCHGVNEVAQDNGPGPSNPPEALRQLLDRWKQLHAPAPQAKRADFNADGRSEIVWHHGGAGVLYQMAVNGALVTGGGVMDVRADAQMKVVGIGDLNGDGRADVVWRHESTGEVVGVLMNGTTKLAEGIIYHEPNLAWKIEQVADIDGDGRADLVWKNQNSGEVYVMRMNGLDVASGQVVYVEPNLNWKIVASGDMNGDGRADLLWRNQATGDVFAMLMNGFTVLSGGVIYTEPNLSWKIIGLADFNGDGRADVLWQNTATGDVFEMQMNGTAVSAGQVIYNEPNTQWRIVALGDYNGGGSADILWRNTVSGAVYMMLMNGFAITGADFIYAEPDQQWQILGP